MAQVYVSYRRGDASAQASRLASDLTDRFGADQVAVDVPMRRGYDGLADVVQAVQGADVVLVLIGPRWADARDPRGDRLIDWGADQVRMEIAAALEAGRRLLPVLVGGAEFPAADALPEDIRDLTNWQALRLDDERWREDLDRVLDVLARAGVAPQATAVVFISHASADREWATTIATGLEARGQRCWIAPRDVPAGTAYARVIPQAIRASRAMVVIVSRRTGASEDVLIEITMAKKHGVRRIPVRIDDAPLDDGLDYMFSQSQWLDLRAASPADAVAALLPILAG
ncbi:MAG: TIR domain-containing protein [Vicinamibacterales bacterium]